MAFDGDYDKVSNSTVAESVPVKNIAIGILGILLALSWFLPWLSIHVSVHSGAITFLKIIDINEQLTFYLGSLAINLNQMSFVAIIFGISIALAFVANLVRIVRKESPLRIVFIVMAVFCALFIIMIFATNAGAMNQISSNPYALIKTSGTVSLTIWPWLAGTASIVGAVFCGGDKRG